MKNITISDNEKGQRVDKFLFKYFNNANTGFVYKMFRKKNIVLNSHKIKGSELLCIGDIITLFISDETHDKFHNIKNIKKNKYHVDILKFPLDIEYEDEHIIIANKPAGLLSQSDNTQVISINDMLLDYTLKKNDNNNNYRAFTPSICNRLDRNTSGLIIFAKTFVAAQNISLLIRKRLIKKFYLTVVNGFVIGENELVGIISKDKNKNFVSYKKISDKDNLIKVSNKVKLKYKALKSTSNFSILEVELITGKSHQIRVQLASSGHFIIGDNKYGNKKINYDYNVKHQLLCAYKLIFPYITEPCLRKLSNKIISIDLSDDFLKFYKRGN